MGYSLNWVGTNIMVNFEGTLRFKDIYNANKKIYKDVRFKEMEYQVVDYRAIRNSNLTPEEITAIGKLEMSASILNNHLKLAFVFDDPKHLVINSQIYIDSLAETGWKLQIFDDIKKAESWCKA